jgi:transposase
VKQLPAKADVQAQEQFKTDTLEPLVEQAQQGHLQLFFVDAAHFVFLPFLGYLYSLVVRYIKCARGRQRYNVLGALNAVSKELITVTNHAYINAAAVCTLLVCLRQKFPRDRLVLVMDNARYQRCQKVFDQAALLHIELLFLPPYSPNLNLIERLWRFVRKEVLYNETYPNYDAFCQAIADCLTQTNTTHKAALDTLLVPKFQSFENVTFLP